MGGTPVGNMIIKVDLDAVGVEKSMTGLQRQLKSSNKAMGAQLSAFGRGEKSAAKYGVLIEGLSNRHRIQGRMVTEARTKYDRMTDAYGENSVKAQQASQELNEQIARYQETGRELETMSAEFQEFQRVQEIQSKGWYKVADGMDEWGGKLKTAGTAMDQTGRKLTRNVTLPLSIVGGLAIKTGVDFEAGMSKVGAVSGASADDMTKLETKAREMGATTVFSAKEASDAFYYMSLAGWDATEMMDGISGVMDLAAASGEDLALVSDIVTDGLTAFGKSAEDSGRMADILASASANANTDVKGLGQAFSYVAPVAGSLGYTMEDTSKAIGLMANSGIKSTKAGTALRTMMTNLSKPTDQAKKAMDKYGISLKDSNGNMKSFDGVMKDLRKGIGKLDKEQQAQAASTIFGKEAMSGALAIINASEEDYKDLTDAIKNSDGAASDMADTMQDNLAGSMKELKSMVEDLFIEMYQNLKPTLESIIDSAKDLTRWFADLSPKTQENILKFGLLAAAMGPVLSVTGKLTFGVGSLMQGTGALAKTIGLSKGAGLLGALGGLGPLAIGGIAVAGLVAVGTAVYQLTKESDELREANLDVATSLNDQAIELEKNANTFDKLSDKAKISNAELAELNDLNKRISESSNPGEIEQLQKQYDELAKNSGLSKKELNQLFEANDNIIKQSSDVKTSVSEQGNEFAKSTEAVHEYVQSLYELSRQELSDEIIIAEENKREILKDNKQLKEDIAGLDQKSKDLRELEAMSEEDRNKALLDWHTQVKQDQQRHKNDQEKLNELKKEEEIITAYLNEGIGSGLKKIREQRDTLNEKIGKNEEELEMINALDEQMSNIILKQAGINEEGEKGLANLDKSIVKNDEGLAKLDEKLDKNGKLTKEEQERYDKLTATNEKQREARDYLFEELGLYKDLNSLAESKLDSADAETQKKIKSLAKSTEIKVEEGNIVKQIEGKNSEIDKSISKLEKEKKEQGANKKKINEQISELKGKKSQNDKVIEQILKELGIWDDVKDSINQGTKGEKGKAKAVGATKGKLDAQGASIDKNNTKTYEGVKAEEARTKEAGKSVDKKVTAKDLGTVAKIDKSAQAPKSKKVSLFQNGLANLNAQASSPKSKKVNLYQSGLSLLNRQASSPVSKVINFVGRGLNNLKFWAKGTPPSGHPGGHAVIGEEGKELVTLPSGKSFLSPSTDTLLDLPKGTHVMPNRATERLMKSIPKYAKGTDGWTDSLRNNEFMKLLAINNKSSKSEVVFTGGTKTKEDRTLKDLLSATLEQNQILMQLLAKDTDVYLDGRIAGGSMEKYITEIQNRNNKVSASFK